ncbi:hypothetical protein PAPYR_5565 [Paratrimastix pyriformis]|uniref:Uncharacterized protein n=1 Tax=Paratrimastix pyriformis TaxID=342808 RepID=A0ABQ8ULN1_9EUKA|nr:hypothetical protein PAPYR_5565 [Paratrimastix pyriformis]
MSLVQAWPSTKSHGGRAGGANFTEPIRPARPRSLFSPASHLSIPDAHTPPAHYQNFSCISSHTSAHAQTTFRLHDHIHGARNNSWYIVAIILSTMFGCTLALLWGWPSACRRAVAQPRRFAGGQEEPSAEVPSVVIETSVSRTGLYVTAIVFIFCFIGLRTSKRPSTLSRGNKFWFQLPQSILDTGSMPLLARPLIGSLGDSPIFNRDPMTITRYYSYYLSAGTNVSFSWKFSMPVGFNVFQRVLDNSDHLVFRAMKAAGSGQYITPADDMYYFEVDNSAYDTSDGWYTLSISRPLYDVPSTAEVLTGSVRGNPSASSTIYLLVTPPAEACKPQAQILSLSHPLQYCKISLVEYCSNHRVVAFWLAICFLPDRNPRRPRPSGQGWIAERAVREQHRAQEAQAQGGPAGPGCEHRHRPDNRHPSDGRHPDHGASQSRCMTRPPPASSAPPLSTFYNYPFQANLTSNVYILPGEMQLVASDPKYMGVKISGALATQTHVFTNTTPEVLGNVTSDTYQESCRVANMPPKAISNTSSAGRGDNHHDRGNYYFVADSAWILSAHGSHALHPAATIRPTGASWLRGMRSISNPNCPRASWWWHRPPVPPNTDRVTFTADHRAMLVFVILFVVVGLALAVVIALAAVLAIRHVRAGGPLPPPTGPHRARRSPSRSPLTHRDDGHTPFLFAVLSGGRSLCFRGPIPIPPHLPPQTLRILFCDRSGPAASFCAAGRS